MTCRLRTLFGTVTMGLFWRSLVHGPLVVYSGHLWPYPPEWSAPMWSDAFGAVEFDMSRCVDCGYCESPPMWRRSWRVA